MFQTCTKRDAVCDDSYLGKQTESLRQANLNGKINMKINMVWLVKLNELDLLFFCFCFMFDFTFENIF